jgi:hypothetical protein
VATARLNAIGEGVARVDIYGSIDALTTIGSGVTLIGALISVTYNSYNRDRTDITQQRPGSSTSIRKAAIRLV